MSEETATVTKPEDDVVVVQDQVVDEEKVHDDLVADVKKLLEQPDDSGKPDKAEKPGGSLAVAKAPPEVGQEADTATADKTKGKTAGDGEGEKEEAQGQELQTRAKGAGLTEDLAKRLQQSGQLEETLASFDRSMIEYVQSKDKSKEAPKDEGQREQEPPPKDQEVPALDPDVYDEDLVKRDAYQQKRIDALESQVQGLVDQQQGGFDEWFDGVLTDLGLGAADDDKCQTIFKAYGAVCDVFGKDARSRDKEMVKRAHAAMYPQDVFKQEQQQTVDRLRDSEGKFLSPSKSQGGPPAKGETNEEVHDQLVSNVTSYLKEQGVQMSGY